MRKKRRKNMDALHLVLNYMKYNSSFSLTFKPAWTRVQEGGSPPSVNDIANTHSRVRNMFLTASLFCSNSLKTYEMTGKTKL